MGKRERAQEFPSELWRYVSDLKSITSDANNADFKPTYQAELDRLQEDTIERYKKAAQILDSMSAKEKRTCRKFAILQGLNEYQADKFRMFLVGGVLCVGPAWLQYRDAFFEYKKLDW